MVISSNVSPPPKPENAPPPLFQQQANIPLTASRCRRHPNSQTHSIVCLNLGAHSHHASLPWPAVSELCRSGASLEQLVNNIHEWHVYFLMRRPFARLNLFLPPSSYSPLPAQCCLQFRPSTVCDALLGPNAGHQHANENQDSEPWSPLFPREGWPSSSSSNP